MFATRALSVRKVVTPVVLGGITLTSPNTYCSERKHKWTPNSEIAKDLKEYGGKSVNSYFKPASTLVKQLHDIAQDAK
jgi:hypothetical protein